MEGTSRPPRPRPAIRSVGLTLVGALLTWVVLQNAWLGDDAYISFRVVDNLTHGYGLRWNVAERVQTFTNPLWVLLLSGISVATREIYWTSLSVSILLTLALFGSLIRLAGPRPAGAVLAATLLINSRSFVDFATSGLENPLTNVLLGALGLVLASCPRGIGSISLGRMLALSSIASALSINRLDLTLLWLPLLSVLFFVRRDRMTFGALLLGLTPLLLWEAFSLVYFGFLIPNTAFAKLATGIPRGDLLEQGWTFLVTCARWDPWLLPTLLAATAAVVVARAATWTLLMAGAWTYVAYAVWVGGDFMVGRLLVAPFVMSLVTLAASIGSAALPSRILSDRGLVVAAVLLLVMGSIPGRAPLRTGPGYYDDTTRYRLELGAGIVDERSFYHRSTNPLRDDGSGPWPDAEMAKWGREFRARDEAGVLRRKLMGMWGYYGGPKLHLFDEWALTDPLLARLPVPEGQWRIGHFPRWIPLGYHESIVEGRDLLVDRDLATYNERLRAVTKGPLLAAARWRAVWELNTGSLEHLIDRDLYRTPDYREFVERQRPD